MDTLGMDSTAPITHEPDVNLLAWRRYDELATAEDNAWFAWSGRPIEWTPQTKEALDLLRAAEDAQKVTAAAKCDIETLKNDDCQCNDHNMHYGTLCSYCQTYKQVIEWSQQ